MPSPRSDEVLNISVELETKAAIRSSQKLNRALKTELDGIAKKVKEVDKTNKKSLKKAVEGTEEWQEAIEDVTDATSKYERVLKNLQARAESASDEEAAGLKETIKLLEKKVRTEKKASRGGRGRAGSSGGRSGGVAVGSGGGGPKESFRDVAREFKDSLKEGMNSFFSKDLKGLAESGLKTVASTLKMTGKGGGAIHKVGAGLSKAGAARGGAMGGAMKAVGGGAKAFGGILQVVGKLGPVLSMVSSAVMAIVKVMIDAEAQAKQFQKELLATASTSEFLADAGGDASVAFDNLEKTVKGVRDAAFSLDNIKWGITDEQTKTTLTTLNQEGVSLRTVGAEAKRSGKSVEEFTGALVHSSVAYSRAFGVPLQEISQMQSELFTEMGQNLESSRLSFAQMTRAAGESGIASNKFFAIIRGVSADLNLYNTRLEDAVKTLKLLGKVMSPKNAQKFMSTATQALKGMGPQELLKTALLGGKQADKALTRSLDRKAEKIGKTIAEAGGAAGLSREDLLSKPVEELMQGVSKEQQGAIREAVTELRMDTKASKKGVFGKAMAMQNVDMGAGLEIMKSSLNIGGTGKLADRIGDIGTVMMAQNQGISLDTLRGMAKFEMAIDDEKETLKAGLDKNDPKVLEKLAKAGITATKAGIDAAGTDQVFDTMDASKQELAKVDAGVQTMGQAQGKLTSSVLDKLSTLVDFVMNQIYNVMLGIWETIADLPIFGDKGQRERIDLVKAIQAGPKSETLQKAASKTKGGGAELSQAILQEGGQKITDALYANVEGNKKATEAQEKLISGMIDSGGGEATLAAASAIGGDIEEKLKALIVGKKLESEKSEMVNQGSSEIDAEAWAMDHEDNFTKRAEDPDVLATWMKELGGISAEDMQGAGFSTLDMAQVANKLGENMDTKDLIAAFPDWESLAGSVSGALDPKKQEAAADAAVSSAEANQALADAGAYKRESLAVKFGPTFLGGKYKKTVEEAVLDAMRTALFEYYMYKDLKQEDVAKYLKDKGMSPQDFAKTAGDNAKQGQTTQDWMQPPTETAAANAAGGMVTGVTDGLANVRAAAGEGLASVGPGERIMSAGGGGRGTGPISVTVNGVGAQDLAKMIEATVIDTVAEYKRRERFN